MRTEHNTICTARHGARGTGLAMCTAASPQRADARLRRSLLARPCPATAGREHHVLDAPARARASAQGAHLRTIDVGRTLRVGPPRRRSYRHMGRGGDARGADYLPAATGVGHHARRVAWRRAARGSCNGAGVGGTDAWDPQSLDISGRTAGTRAAVLSRVLGDRRCDVLPAGLATECHDDVCPTWRPAP